jgi:hypothetical protein
MDAGFRFDVFLSHSTKDKAVVRPLAERLRKHGLKVWFDEWVLKPGDSIPAKIDPPSLRSYGRIEEGLEHSRVLACPAATTSRMRMLCLSANAFGSDLAQTRLTHYQQSTLNHQPTGAPLNQERRFIPLRLDEARIRGSLAQFFCLGQSGL